MKKLFGYLACFAFLSMVGTYMSLISTRESFYGWIGLAFFALLYALTKLNDWRERKEEREACGKMGRSVLSVFRDDKGNITDIHCRYTDTEGNELTKGEIISIHRAIIRWLCDKEPTFAEMES